MREFRTEQFSNLPEISEYDARLLDAASDEVLTAAVEAHVLTRFGIDDYFRERLTSMLAGKYEITPEEAQELFNMRVESHKQEIKIRRYSRHG